MHTHSSHTHFLPQCAPAGHIETHLRYPHCWVWLTASQLFGQLFAAHQAEQLVAVWRGEGGDASPQSAATAFITNGLDKKVRPRKSRPALCDLVSESHRHCLNVLFPSDVQMRELALTFCHQLQSKFLDTASGEQVLYLSQKPHFSSFQNHT